MIKNYFHVLKLNFLESVKVISTFYEWRLIRTPKGFNLMHFFPLKSVLSIWIWNILIVNNTFLQYIPKKVLYGIISSLQSCFLSYNQFFAISRVWPLTSNFKNCDQFSFLRQFGYDSTTSYLSYGIQFRCVCFRYIKTSKNDIRLQHYNKIL